MTRLALLVLVLLPSISRADPPAVRVEVFARDVPSDRWAEKLPAASENYDEPAFAFCHLPWKYTGTGVRTDRGNPYHVRATADVKLPPGPHRVLLRARSAARLTADGKVVAELPFNLLNGEGLTPVRRDALTLGRTRYIAPGDFEKVAEFTATGEQQRFVLELVVGRVVGKDERRAELGESLVAVAPSGSNDFRLLAPSRSIPLTDEGWEAFADERRVAHEQIEAERRRAAFESQADYWTSRRDLASRFLHEHPAPAVPPATKSLPANNAIDHFVNAKLGAALAAAKTSSGTVHFHRDIQSILTAKCVSCHGANKPKGGLRLDLKPTAERLAEAIRRVKSDDADEVMPPKGERLTKSEIALLETWHKEGAAWPDEPPLPPNAVTQLSSDEEFLRRIYLDAIGTVPTAAGARRFLDDRSPDKRIQLIDALLADPRWADGWMPYWLDVLAENSNLVNPTLNNTGPFRFWLHDALRDNKPWDVAVTELVLMEGSVYGGGPAGFGIAAQNDAPMAAKAGILASAFLAVEMKCARCHDAPYHQVTQADLFHLAAMLDRKPVNVPSTSSVPLDKFGGRVPLVSVTLKPGTKVTPEWSLVKLFGREKMPPLQPGKATDTRAQLAALITAPGNERFAEVMVNRVWRRFLGRGLVEPPQDWDRATPSHPELLKWLAREFVRSGYDLKYVSRLIFTSHAYQRKATADRDAVRLFAAPQKRRLGPDALADSLFDAFGRRLDTEILCFDLDGIRPVMQGRNFGVPRRAWQIPYLSNDRDRPTLSLPKAQAITELMAAFGWDGNRQFPVTDRGADAMLLQPALLANGSASWWLTRLSDDTELVRACSDARTPEELVETLFLRTLSRRPVPAEKQAFVALLAPGFADRHVAGPFPPAGPRPRQPYTSWASHHTDDAVAIKAAETDAVRRGPPPTSRLQAEWRTRAEDALWALLNSPELVFIP